jgi:hypothetical protein
MTDWNTFNRELQNRVSDPGLRYILGLIYERVLDLTTQQERNADMTLKLAEALTASIDLSDLVLQDIRALNKIVKGERDGVELRSIPLTNED